MKKAIGVRRIGTSRATIGDMERIRFVKWHMILAKSKPNRSVNG